MSDTSGVSFDSPETAETTLKKMGYQTEPGSDQKVKVLKKGDKRVVVARVGNETIVKENKKKIRFGITPAARHLIHKINEALKTGQAPRRPLAFINPALFETSKRKCGAGARVYDKIMSELAPATPAARDMIAPSVAAVAQEYNDLYYMVDETARVAGINKDRIDRIYLAVVRVLSTNRAPPVKSDQNWHSAERFVNLLIALCEEEGLFAIKHELELSRDQLVPAVMVALDPAVAEPTT